MKEEKTEGELEVRWIAEGATWWQKERQEHRGGEREPERERRALDRERERRRERRGRDREKEGEREREVYRESDS